MAEKKDNKIIADNRKARHDYFVEEVYEAGIELFGTEVKSLRAGGVNLKDSYCEIDGGEMFALGVHISPYDHGNIFNKDPLRPKKLLMHKREIMKLTGLISRDGYTLVPNVEDCFCDKIHPNEYGSLLLAQNLYKIVKKVKF